MRSAVLLYFGPFGMDLCILVVDRYADLRWLPFYLSLSRHQSDPLPLSLFDLVRRPSPAVAGFP